MSNNVSLDMVLTAIAAIEEVSSRIEESVAAAGQRLGRGHAIFQGLNQALSALAEELSSSQIESASAALHDIAERLNGLAEALPAESELLGRLDKVAVEASGMLKPLFKHVQMISIIARSARIEAAALADNRESFLAFTREANDLAQMVERSLAGCLHRQDRLTRAIEVALNRHTDFDQRYRNKLTSAGNELVSAYAGMRQQRSQSVRLMELASSSTKRIADSIGRSIVSLQTGDSTRQRLEHVCYGLRLAGKSQEPELVRAPEVPVDVDLGFLYRLQAAQLADTQCELAADVGRIKQALSAILRDASEMVAQGRSLYGNQGEESASFLTRIRENLAQVSNLITTCESAGKSVDEALTVLEDTLSEFRVAIAGLSEAVIDITLIGMNAGLKASHLGNKGNAFVVIANELKASADQVAAASGRLRPVLNGIEDLARNLRALRVRGDQAHLAQLESSILNALRQIEAGNKRLGGLVDRVIAEGVEFEGLIRAAQELLSALDERAAALPGVASRLDGAGALMSEGSPVVGGESVFDEIFESYTMERERDMHREFLNNFGLGPKAAPRTNSVEADGGVLLF